MCVHVQCRTNRLRLHQNWSRSFSFCKIFFGGGGHAPRPHQPVQASPTHLCFEQNIEQASPPDQKDLPTLLCRQSVNHIRYDSIFTATSQTVRWNRNVGWLLVACLLLLTLTCCNYRNHLAIKTVLCWSACRYVIFSSGNWLLDTI